MKLSEFEKKYPKCPDCGKDIEAVGLQYKTVWIEKGESETISDSDIDIISASCSTGFGCWDWLEPDNENTGCIYERECNRYVHSHYLKEKQMKEKTGAGE